MDINDKTKVSLYAVLAVLPFAAGAILWMANVSSTAQAAASDASDLKVLVLDVIERLARIEGQINKGERYDRR